MALKHGLLPKVKKNRSCRNEANKTFSDYSLYNHLYEMITFLKYGQYQPLLKVLRYTETNGNKHILRKSKKRLLQTTADQ